MKNFSLALALALALALPLTGYAQSQTPLGSLPVVTSAALVDTIAVTSDNGINDHKIAIGNLFKTTRYADFQAPSYGDAVGAVPQTNNLAATGFMHWTFSGTAATNVNYVRYEWAVPDDIDTTSGIGSLKITRFKFSTAGTSNSQINFHVAYGASAVTAGRTPTIAGHVLFNVTPTSAAANDIFEATAVTIAASSELTAGQHLVIEIARDGADTNNDAMTDAFLRLEYPATK